MFEIIALAVLLGGIVIYLLVDRYRKKELKNIIGWCATKDSNLCRCNLSLKSYILNLQIQMKLLPEYRITEDEWSTVELILADFQKKLLDHYFSDSVHIPKSKYVIKKEIYFMFMLQEYLCQHQCEYRFLEHDMHQDVISHKSYGSWGGSLYDATYSLTDFAITFHKLYYVAYMSCKNDKFLEAGGYRFNKERDIENIIDSKRISVSRV
jgi:hypothetical protein